jgi:hypothetical protein
VSYARLVLDRQRAGRREELLDQIVLSVSGVAPPPDSPISRGRLCPKGSASEKLVNSPMRETNVRYRRPGGTEWEDLTLEQATEMIADRIIAARAETWEDADDDGQPLNRTLGMHFLGSPSIWTTFSSLTYTFLPTADRAVRTDGLHNAIGGLGARDEPLTPARLRRTTQTERIPCELAQERRDEATRMGHRALHSRPRCASNGDGWLPTCPVGIRAYMSTDIEIDRALAVRHGNAERPAARAL